MFRGAPTFQSRDSEARLLRCDYEGSFILRTQKTPNRVPRTLAGLIWCLYS